MPLPSTSMEYLARQVKIALQSGDLAPFSDLLDPNVRWGAPGDQAPPCQSRQQVLAWYQRSRAAGVRAEVLNVDVVGDRLVVELVVAGAEAARERGGQAVRWQVLTVRDGRVVEIVAFDEHSEALAWAGVPAA